MKLNLDYLLESVWEYLCLVRVFTKKRGGELLINTLLKCPCSHQLIKLLVFTPKFLKIVDPN